MNNYSGLRGYHVSPDNLYILLTLVSKAHTINLRSLTALMHSISPVNTCYNSFKSILVITVSVDIKAWLKKPFLYVNQVQKLDSN